MVKTRILYRNTGEIFEVTNRKQLYNVAFDISLRNRGAVYFNSKATIPQLLDDLRGANCRIETVEEGD